MSGYFNALSYLLIGAAIGTPFWWVVLPRLLSMPRFCCPLSREWWYMEVVLRWRYWRRRAGR
jgi:hypothetical protein